MIDSITSLAFSMFENKGVYALLLGSGLSRSAQIPTGWEITLDLVRRIAALEGISEQDDWSAWHVERFGGPPNYSTLLDALSTTAAERRAILHAYIEPTDADIEVGAKRPTPAHHAIARLVRDGYVRVIITTNFDRLLENALREAGIEPTVVKSEDDLAGAVPITHSRCYVLKVHGDYLDTRLLNTDAELSAYGEQQNRCLDRILDEHGLLVCGWSGDWDPALRAAISRTPSRRYPVYWAGRGNPAAAGQELIDHRGARIVGIADADSFFTSLQQKIETLAAHGQPHPQSADLLVASAKRFLARSEHRIQLADLLHGELMRAREALGATGISVNDEFSVDAFKDRLLAYENHYEPLCRAALSMGRWGLDDEHGLTVDLLGAMTGLPSEGGNAAWLKLRLYPAALFFTAYAMGLTKANRLVALRRWFQNPLKLERWRDEGPAVEQLFGEFFEQGETNLWNMLDPGQRRYTPYDDYLLTVFQRWGEKDRADPRDVELTFEWLELLVGVDETTRNTDKGVLENSLENNSHHTFIWSVLGRFSWHREYRDQLLNRLTAEPSRSALLDAGFANGDSDHLELVERNFQKTMARRR